MPNKKILAILQNQWFRNPGQVKAIYQRYPEQRNRLIRDFLFMGCLSGKRLMSALGEELCYQIIWEEASPEIGSYSGSNFGADLVHIRSAIKKHSPEIVVAFGKIAGDAVRLIEAEKKIKLNFLYGPHPAARINPVEAFSSLRLQINELKEEFGHAG